MCNVLITSGGRRVSLVKAFMHELNKVRPLGKVFVTDSKPELSASAHAADKAIKICRIEDDNFIETLLSICIKNNITLVVPTIDTELLILTKNRERFLKLGIIIVLSDENFIEISSDKLKTQNLFKKLNINCAKVYNKDDYQLPLFIKPIDGSSSLENYLIKDKNQISKYHLETNSLLFFEYLDHDIYDEYTCDLYYDRKSILKCVIPRKRIEVRAGEVSKSLTKKNELKAFIENNLSYLKGAHACVTMQFFLNKNNNSSIKGIEINARFGGGFPLSYLAGGNYPKWIIEEYIMNKKLSYFDDWKNNLLMLRYDNEVLVENYKD
jgi:carbamoyl-phosphate synthase large subunit